jgi:hypothetical protein
MGVTKARPVSALRVFVREIEGGREVRTAEARAFGRMIEREREREGERERVHTLNVLEGTECFEVCLTTHTHARTHTHTHTRGQFHTHTYTHTYTHT